MQTIWRDNNKSQLRKRKNRQFFVCHLIDIKLLHNKVEVLWSTCAEIKSRLVFLFMLRLSSLIFLFQANISILTTRFLSRHIFLSRLAFPILDVFSNIV